MQRDEKCQPHFSAFQNTTNLHGELQPRLTCSGRTIVVCIREGAVLKIVKTDEKSKDILPHPKYTPFIEKSGAFTFHP